MYSVRIDSSEGFIKTGQFPILTVLSAGHALHVFINGQLSGIAGIAILVILKIFKINQVYQRINQFKI